MIRIDNYDFSGKRALIRVDFNVPLNERMEVTDATRIEAALPTITMVLNGGGAVVLMSHLGRPKGEPSEKFSLKHIIDTLSEKLGREVTMATDCIGEDARAASSKLRAGQVLLLENLRFHKEETSGDEFFAGQLAEHGDCYINDAFGTAHRAHASTTTVAKFFPTDKMFGALLQNEIENMNRALHSENKPVLAIIGGAKISTKITVVENLLDKVDDIIIGGGMAYTMAKAKGGRIGDSLFEEDFLETAKMLYEKAVEKKVNIHIPSDTVIADEFRNDASTDVCLTTEIPDGWMGLDIGPKTMDSFSSLIENAKVVLWNGPMGVFEMETFAKGTVAVAKALATATKKGAYTLLGGGDSVAAINKFGLSEQVSYVSTGGGAMLEYLEGKTLPGIAAIED
ncbi:MAG: phosphoglycerate kinase [Flavobacteriales bacterium]|nr:phosphoglycerate kinase [Flavobacteriales bacterium]